MNEQVDHDIGNKQRLQAAIQGVRNLSDEAVVMREKGYDEVLVVEAYKRAIEAARATLDDFPGNVELAALHMQALGALNELRQFSQLVRNARRFGHFRQLLLYLDSLPDDDSKGSYIGHMSVAEARRVCMRQANEWVMHQTPKKIEEARHALYELQDPEKAYRILEAFKLLVAGLMPDPEKDAIDQVVRDEIEPARKRRREAV